MDTGYSALANLARGRGVELVYECLKHDIIDVALGPGAPIDEEDLARRFSLSRTPVRAALVRLACEGLVDIQPHRAPTVAAIDMSTIPQYYEAFILMLRVTARCAAENYLPHDISILEISAGALRNALATGNTTQVIGANAAFHEKIAAVGRNSHFSWLLSRLLTKQQRLWHWHRPNSRTAELPIVLDDHSAIITAIVERNVEEADRLSRARAEQIAARMSRVFEQLSNSEIELP